MQEQLVCPAAPVDAATLEATLRQELGLLEALNELLAAERGALIRRDAAGIASLAHDKRAALEALTVASTLSRAQWNDHHRSASGTAARPAQSATRLLNAVRNAWRRAERANQCNSAVLKLHQATVLRGLGVLRQAAGGTELYRADGRSGGHYLSS